MTRATRHFHNRIAVVFDFDDTLAGDSLDALMRRLGHEPRAFRRERIQPLVDDGWDASLARLYAIIRAARAPGAPALTRALLAEVGRELAPFDGVPALFEVVRRSARAIVPDVAVEFYVVSCGLRDVVAANAVAGEFDHIWGSELHFDEDGRADFVKQVITFGEKVSYILQLSKGLSVQGPVEEADVWRHVPETELHVPLDQMVYVGDGGSDMPVFDLLYGRGGFAIAVYKPGQSAAEWAGMEQMRDQRRVENLAPAEYGEGGELLGSIVLATEAIAKRLALRRLGVGE